MITSATQRMLAALATAEHARERTTKALASAAHVSRQRAEAIMHAQHLARQIHVVDWHTVGRAGTQSAVWVLGPGDDVPRPIKHGPRSGNWRTAPSGQRLAAWFAAGNRGTARAAGKACACSVPTAQAMCAQMAADDALRIAWYQRSTEGGPAAPVFEARQPGDKRHHAKRPKAMGVTERRKRRQALIREVFGDDSARRIYQAMYGMPAHGTTVVVDGTPIYRRGQGVLVPLSASTHPEQHP